MFTIDTLGNVLQLGRNSVAWRPVAHLPRPTLCSNQC